MVNIQVIQLIKVMKLYFACDLKNTGKLHDINLIMYVALHELAHVACPENNHTPSIYTYFYFFLKIAMNVKIYTKMIIITKNPVEYCGINVNETPIKK